jgi:AcrR family transcriptional regulator
MDSPSQPGRPVSRRERPAKPALTRDGIVEAALRLMAAEGLERVTMRRLAEELDTGPASLYVYLEDVAELHGAILDRLLGDVVPPPRAREWGTRIERTLLAYGAILFEHPSLARSIFARRPSGPHYLELVESVLADMADGGVPSGRAAWGIDVLLQLITATAVEQVTRRESPEAAAEVERERDAFQATPDRFPHIHALAAELVSGSGRERLRWAIQALLAGIAATPRVGSARNRTSRGRA